MAIMISIRFIRQQNSSGLGAAPLDFVVSIVFLLHYCMCTSSLVLLPALRISHLRLLAFHQHCNYSCIGAKINLSFVCFHCNGSAVCEYLKVPCPTPALRANSLHTSAIPVFLYHMLPGLKHVYTKVTFQRQTAFILFPLHPSPLFPRNNECQNAALKLFLLCHSAY